MKTPTPPVEWGPTLEWHQSPRRTRYQAALIMGALGAVVFTLRHWGFDWVTDWYYWLIIAILTITTYLLLQGDSISAGARWLWFRGTFIATYRLSKVELTRSYMRHELILHGPRETSPRTWRLRLNSTFRSISRWTHKAMTLGEYAPTAEQQLRVDVDIVQENPKLWALVYNGIRHSVNNGAHCDDETRALLGLDLWPDVDAWSTPFTGNEEELRQGEQAIDAHAAPDIAEELKKELRRHYRDQQ